MLRAIPIRPRPAVAGKWAPGKPQAPKGKGRADRSSGPCILWAVVESTGRARQTGSGPGPRRPQEAARSSRPSFGKESPNSCQGLPQTNGERARIRKDGPQQTKEVPRCMVPERTEAYAGVDVSKERLEVCVRRGREAREGEHTFGLSNDPAGTQTLLARLLEERPVLVILEATGGFERPVAAALAAAGLPIAVVNPRQAREFARARPRRGSPSVGRDHGSPSAGGGDAHRREQPPRRGHHQGCAQAPRSARQVVGEGALSHRPGSRGGDRREPHLARERRTAARRAGGGARSGKDALGRATGARQPPAQAAGRLGRSSPAQQGLRRLPG